MRGSVVFLAVFAVTSCSAGVNGRHFVKSGLTGPGTGRGNEDAPGIEESAFGSGENDGHRIGKRSSPGRDVDKQAAFRSAAGRRQQIVDSNAPFPKPFLPPQFLIPPIVEVPPPNPTYSILLPPLLSKLSNYPPLVKSRDLPLRRVTPSALERKARSLPTFKFLPLSKAKGEAMKIISNALSHAHILPAIFPKPSAGRSFARSQDFHRSDLKNSCCRSSGLRSYSPLRSYPTLPGPLTEDVIAMPLYKYAGNPAPALPGTEENFRSEVRSAVIKYLVQLWHKISKWFKPGSNSGGGMGGLPPEEENPTEEGVEPGPHLPGEDEVHTEPPPEEYIDDVVEPITPPVDAGDEVIHLLAEEDAPETAEDPAEEGGSDVHEDYYGPTDFNTQENTNWEVRDSTSMGDGYIDAEDGTYLPSWYGPIAESMSYSNWEARRAVGEEDGSEDVASKIEGTSSGTRGENMHDDLDTVTDIFGRLADINKL